MTTTPITTRWPLLLALLLPACAAPPRAPVDPLVLETAVRELLTQATEDASNRLGRPGGFYSDPRVRIPLPPPVLRIEHGLRRYGLERYADELVQSMNRAAEAAVPAAKPVLLAAVRELRISDAVGIVRGGDDAATRYFRAHTEAGLTTRLRPIVADATARVGVLASYKRLLKKAAVLDRSVDLSRFDVDAYLTAETLNGLYLATAAEERRIRDNPLGASTDLLRGVLR